MIDLGLRLADIEGLPSEPVDYKQNANPRRYLQYDCGATKEEAEFLVSGGYRGRWHGERVEINAMTSDQLIAWLERKFAEHGIQKLLPDEDTLSDAYRRAVFLKRIEQKIAEIEGDLQDEECNVPKRLSARVKAILRKDPSMAWDEAVWNLAEVAETDDA